MRRQWASSLALCAQPADHAGELGALFIGERTLGFVHERGDRCGARTVEERSEQMPDRGPLRDITRRRGMIDVSWTVFFVSEMPLLFEDAKQELLVSLRNRRSYAAAQAKSRFA